MSRRFQIRTVNKAIADTGLELVRGEGYFYFVGDGSENLYTDSVMVYRINHLRLETWIKIAKSYATEIRSRA